MNTHPVVQEIRRLAEESPDFVYVSPDHEKDPESNKCYYVHDGKPSCIVGRALWNLGLMTEEPEHLDCDASAIAVFEDLGLDISKADADWAQSIQNLQDSQTPWGEAVERSDVK